LRKTKPFHKKRDRAFYETVLFLKEF